MCYAAVRPLISAVSGVQFPPEVMKVDPGRLKTLSFTNNLLLVKPKSHGERNPPDVPRNPPDVL